MIRLKPILTSIVISVFLGLTILSMALIVSNIQPVQAGGVNYDQPVVITIETNVHYLPLTDAPPRRDITQQQFAPLTSTP